MADQGTRLLDIQVITTANTSVMTVVVDQANSVNAQTALIDVHDLINSLSLNITANTLLLVDERSDPASSDTLIIAKGVVFRSANFLYVATANNHVKRAALSDF